jgi:hypothetical protein
MELRQYAITTQNSYNFDKKINLFHTKTYLNGKQILLLETNPILDRIPPYLNKIFVGNDEMIQIPQVIRLNWMKNIIIKEANAKTMTGPTNLLQNFNYKSRFQIIEQIIKQQPQICSVTFKSADSKEEAVLFSNSFISTNSPKSQLVKDIITIIAEIKQSPKLIA